MSIDELLLGKFSGDGRVKRFREHVAAICHKFIELGLSSPNFETQLSDDTKFWECVSEALLANHLYALGLSPLASRRGNGPDLLVMDDENKIWIEVTCPKPEKISQGWLNPQGSAFALPDEEILLRWTSAIKKKTEKLLGKTNGSGERISGYLEKGVVGQNDAYVIAVNGRQLRSPGFSSLNGVSGYPFAVQAVLAVGPFEVTLNRDTLEQIEAGYGYRPFVNNGNGSPVPTDMFLCPEFSSVSAIWAVDIDGSAAIGNREPMVVVHNPYADNRIQVGVLPAQKEYVARIIPGEGYTLEELDGCLMGI